MARKGYSTVFDAEKTATSRGVDVHCSPKASRNIVKTIKGMRLEDAKEFLEAVTRKETAVPMTVRKQKIKHRKGQGFGPGAYPVKAAGRVLKILENAENNAEYKDLETENLRIVHASAYRGETIVKFRPRAQGRATPSCEQTTNMEIVLGEDEALDEREEAREARRERATKRAVRTGAKPTKTAATAKKPAKKEEAAEEKESTEAAESKAEPEAETPAETEPAEAGEQSDKKEES